MCFMSDLHEGKTEESIQCSMRDFVFQYIPEGQIFAPFHLGRGWP
jgi:hypothetical protein